MMKQEIVHIVSVNGQVVTINNHTIEFHSYEDADAFVVELALKGFFDYNPSR